MGSVDHTVGATGVKIPIDLCTPLSHTLQDGDPRVAPVKAAEARGQTMGQPQEQFPTSRYVRFLNVDPSVPS